MQPPPSKPTLNFHFAIEVTQQTTFPQDTSKDPVVKNILDHTLLHSPQCRKTTAPPTPTLPYLPLPQHNPAEECFCTLCYNNTENID